MAVEVDDKEFNQILDEIDENENKQAPKEEKLKNEVDWKEILRQIRAKNVTFIKNMISSKEIDVNAQNPSDGKTLLIYAVVIGEYDLVKSICNFGGDVKITDKEGYDALDYAVQFGKYKITELVYYRQLSGSLGNDLKDISTKIREKTKEAEYCRARV